MHNLPMEYFIATTHCSFSGPGSVQSDIQETLIKSQNYKYKLTKQNPKRLKDTTIDMFPDTSTKPKSHGRHKRNPPQETNRTSLKDALELALLR